MILAITSGEPAGIGPDLCAALPRREWPARLVVLGDRRLLAERARLIEDYRKRFLNPYAAANAGYIDDVIEPRETRARVIQALRALRNKTSQPIPRKHGNMPV